MSLDLTAFAQGFVAKLISLGTTAIYPKSIDDRLAFQQVVETIDFEIDRLEREGRSESEIFDELVFLRNSLQASNTGAFDNFEHALQRIQCSFTQRPNPFYDRVSFSVSRPFAESFLSGLSNDEANVITRAAEAFVHSKAKRLEEMV